MRRRDYTWNPEVCCDREKLSYSFPECPGAQVCITISPQRLSLAIEPTARPLTCTLMSMLL
jgi:hypothetical protein